MGFYELFRADLGEKGNDPPLLGAWRATRFAGRAHAPSRFTARLDAWRQRGPALTRADVGKVLTIVNDQVMLNGRGHHVRWAGAAHGEVCGVRIVSVEEIIKGVVELEDGTTLQNPVGDSGDAAAMQKDESPRGRRSSQADRLHKRESARAMRLSKEPTARGSKDGPTRQGSKSKGLPVRKNNTGSSKSVTSNATPGSTRQAHLR